MLNLLWLMTQRLGILFIVAFALTRSRHFRKLLEHKPDFPTMVKMAVLFGLFGILGTYTGISVKPTEYSLFWVPSGGHIGFEEAIANSRVVGVVSGGLLGGPFVGLAAGLIAGVQRMTLGGFSGLACGISTITEGLLAGLIYRRQKDGRLVSVRTAFLTGVLAESLQMVIILLVAKPFNMAWILVQMIALPMILTNSVGIAAFVAIIKSVVDKENKIEAVQTQKVLRIADEMLSHLRQGLNPESARAVLKIIHETSQVAAVSIIQDDRLLAHIGAGEDQNKPGKPLPLGVREKIRELDKITILSNKEEINCIKPGCPLEAAILVPLRKREEQIGVLCFYYRNFGEIKPADKELAEGLGKLLSHQLEVAEAEKQAALLNAAEIRALQAQVNPHFLFNSLNTIVALVRTNPDMARSLLVQLGNFFRQNLNAHESEAISLEQELKHTEAYLNIEQVRFSDRLTVCLEVAEGLQGVQIPPLTLQPLVENALKHGLGEIPEGGKLVIRAEKVKDRAKITVEDNGVGFPADKSEQFLWKKPESGGRSGLGLYNVNQRLIGIFGQGSRLHIEKARQGGTIVWFELPAGEVVQNGN